MRQFSSEEQHITKIISEGKETNVQTLLDKKLLGVRISLDRTAKTHDLLFQIVQRPISPPEFQALVERVGQLTLDIIITVNLLKMLADEHYIILVERTNIIPTKFEFGQGASNAASVKYKFADENVGGLLLDYASKEIITTPELTRFVEQGFIARDEQRFQLQIATATNALKISKRAFRLSIAAISLTFLGMCINLFFNIRSYMSSGIKIKQEQIDTLSSDFNAVKQDLDTLISINRNDNAQQPKVLKRLNNSKTQKNRVK
ncbi:hypothetical protein ACTJKN_25795 [Pedobacter sp. 22163]|uniref:hypothetical protein n=1 Tax=Pedobacter sp. 22163 TaxID=3453883 RepID=UPI003F837A63